MYMHRVVSGEGAEYGASLRVCVCVCVHPGQSLSV